MKKRKSMKQRLATAAVILVMLISSIIGTTFAWFTESIYTTNNLIEAGNLQIDLLHKKVNTWTSVKDNPDHKIFNYSKWEPGYTAVEELKIENLGTLALKYKLSIAVAEGSAEIGKNGQKLADVIDVYVFIGENPATGFQEIKENWDYKGALSDVMQNPSDFIYGEMTSAGESHTLFIALHMRESANDSYQRLSVGNLYVSLVATQKDSESDNFGPDYDNGANLP